MDVGQGNAPDRVFEVNKTVRAGRAVGVEHFPEGRGVFGIWSHDNVRRAEPIMVRVLGHLARGRAVVIGWVRGGDFYWQDGVWKRLSLGAGEKACKQGEPGHQLAGSSPPSNRCSSKQVVLCVRRRPAHTNTATSGAVAGGGVLGVFYFNGKSD